jgi:site-specific recombinase XerD
MTPYTNREQLLSDESIILFFRKTKCKQSYKSSTVNAMLHLTNHIQMMPFDFIVECEKEIDDGVKLKYRKVNTVIESFWDDLNTSSLSLKSKEHYIKIFKNFLLVHDIQLSYFRLPKGLETIPENNMIPEIDDIRVVLQHTDKLEKAIILVAISSGMGGKEIRHLKLQTFRDGQSDDGITTIHTYRFKTNHPYITFLTPEATQAVNEYLIYRDALAISNRERDIETYNKRKTTPDSYLFINDRVNDSYLTMTDESLKGISREELRKLKARNFSKRFAKLANKAGYATPEGIYNLIRGHNMRKVMTSILKNKGMDSERVEYMTGHSLGETKNAYYRGCVEDLKAMYVKYIAYLTVTEKYDVKQSPEYIDMVKTVEDAKLEAHKAKVERSEYNKLQAQMQKMQAEQDIERKSNESIMKLLAEGKPIGKKILERKQLRDVEDGLTAEDIEDGLSAEDIEGWNDALQEPK